MNLLAAGQLQYNWPVYREQTTCSHSAYAACALAGRHPIPVLLGPGQAGS